MSQAFADRLKKFPPMGWRVRKLVPGDQPQLDVSKGGPAVLEIDGIGLAIGAHDALLSLIGTWECFRVLGCMRDLMMEARTVGRSEEVHALLLALITSGCEEADRAIREVEAGMRAEESRAKGEGTANFPWALYDPKGRMHCAGAEDGEPTYGMAWSDCLAAMRLVALRGAKSIARMDALERKRPSEIRWRAA